MVAALIVLDGAAEPPSPGASSLERASTPALDALAASGTVARVATTPQGLEPGSEVGIPTLLGAAPAGPVSRGLVEAAAAGICVGPGERAWRIDLHLPSGDRACAREAAVVAALLRRRLPRHAIHQLRGHRLLAVGAAAPQVTSVAGLSARVWGDGAGLPETLDARTAVVCGPGAAAGCAALLGARVLRPAGATGDVDTDLDAKAAAALAALEHADLVVVHVGGPDEASHRRDREAKRAAIEHADSRLVAPLAAAVARAGGRIAVTCDHTTCPATGRHGAGPVPIVGAGAGIPAGGFGRLAERAASGTPVLAQPWPVGAPA